MNDFHYIWYRMSLKDKEFLEYIRINDINYKRFNFWYRTTAINIELAILYKIYNH